MAHTNWGRVDGPWGRRIRTGGVEGDVRTCSAHCVCVPGGLVDERRRTSLQLFKSGWYGNSAPTTTVVAVGITCGVGVGPPVCLGPTYTTHAPLPVSEKNTRAMLLSADCRVKKGDAPSPKATRACAWHSCALLLRLAQLMRAVNSAIYSFAARESRHGPRTAAAAVASCLDSTVA